MAEAATSSITCWDVAANIPFEKEEVLFGREKVRYGWVKWQKTRLGFFLLCVVTLFLCLGIIYGGWHGEFDLDINKPNNQPTASVSPGYISLSHKILDNGNTVQVVSHSSVSLDVLVEAKDGRDLFTYFGLMPDESFYFEYEEPCTIIGTAS